MAKTSPPPTRKKAVPEALKRKKHALRTSKSDARRRDEGLTRISIWVPSEHIRQVRDFARELVDRHRALATEPRPTLTQNKVEIPKPWRDPKPKYDHRQRSLHL